MASRADINRAARTRDELLMDLLADHQERLKASMSTLERRVVRMTANFNTKDGRLLTDRINLQIAAQARADLAGLFEREFNEAFVSTVIQDFDKVALSIKDYYVSVGIPVSFIEADMAVINELKLGAFQQFTVLGEQFQQAMANEMYMATVVGRPFDEMVLSLQNSLRGIEDMAGRPMSVHASTLAHDALVEFDATLNKKKADEANIDNFLYFGSTVTDSRDFCLNHVGETHTEKEWYDIAASETPWQGQKSGDFFLVRGGWNCGHQLVAILEEEDE